MRVAEEAEATGPGRLYLYRKNGRRVWDAEYHPRDGGNRKTWRTGLTSRAQAEEAARAKWAAPPEVVPIGIGRRPGFRLLKPAARSAPRALDQRPRAPTGHVRCASCEVALPPDHAVEMNGKQYHPRACFAGALASYVDALITARVSAAVADHESVIFARIGSIVNRRAVGGPS